MKQIWISLCTFTLAYLIGKAIEMDQLIINAGPGENTALRIATAFRIQTLLTVVTFVMAVLPTALDKKKNG